MHIHINCTYIGSIGRLSNLMTDVSPPDDGLRLLMLTISMPLVEQSSRARLFYYEFHCE